MRHAIVIASALVLCTCPALADEPATPVTTWIVASLGDSPITVQRQGEHPLGTVAGWKCTATISTETPSGKARIDSMTVACTKGDLTVRSQARYAEGTPSTDPVPLQVIVANKPVRTIVFGPK